MKTYVIKNKEGRYLDREYGPNRVWTDNINRAKLYTNVDEATKRISDMLRWYPKNGIHEVAEVQIKHKPVLKKFKQILEMTIERTRIELVEFEKKLAQFPGNNYWAKCVSNTRETLLELEQIKSQREADGTLHSTKQRRKIFQI